MNLLSRIIINLLADKLNRGSKQSNSQSSNRKVKSDKTLESCVRESPKGWGTMASRINNDTEYHEIIESTFQLV